LYGDFNGEPGHTKTGPKDRKEFRRRPPFDEGKIPAGAGSRVLAENRQ